MKTKIEKTQTKSGPGKYSCPKCGKAMQGIGPAYKSKVDRALGIVTLGANWDRAVIWEHCNIRYNDDTQCMDLLDEDGCYLDGNFIAGTFDYCYKAYKLKAFW